MPDQPAAPSTIDEYLAGFPDEVRAILQKIRETVRAAAPEAEEVISYRMPTFKQHGVLIHFAAFQSHIGVYPPVEGDARLVKACAAYANEKGNLRFPLDEPMPYDLIRRITARRVRQNQAKADARKAARRKAARRQRPD